MARHRTHSITFKRQVVQEYLAGETLHGLARRHDLSRTLIRIWVDKYEAGDFDEDAEAASMMQEYEARIAALERLVGKQALELEFLKGAQRQGRRPGSAPMSVHHRPEGLSIAEGCRLMGIARSIYYRASNGSADDTALVEAMHAIKDEFEAYGWRAHAGGAQASRLGGEPQEDQAPDARARHESAAPPALRRHDRQRSRRTGLPRSLQGLRGGWPEPSSGLPT